jgi:non-ribosomal peptide synthetase component F
LAGLLRHEHASLALAQRCSGVGAQVPLFTSLLNYRYTRASLAEPETQPLAEVLWGEERTNYPLMLAVDDLGDGFVLTVQASEGIDAERVCDYVQTALRHLVEALERTPELSVSSVEVMPVEERERLLEQGRGEEPALWAGETVHGLFEAQVERTPEAIAVQSGSEALSYRELNERAERVARQLWRQGLSREERVAICMDRGVNLLAALLGTLKAGGAYVPLDPGYPRERLWGMLMDSEPRVVLVDALGREALGEVEQVQLSMDALESWPEAEARQSEAVVEASGLAYVIYTSGTTGKPKGVCVTHQGVTNFLKAMAREPGLGSEDVLLAVTTLSFDIAVLELYLPLMVGGRVVIAGGEQAKDGEALREAIEGYGVTVMQGTPSTWRLLLAASEGAWLGVKVLCGGERLPEELARQLVQSSPSVWNLYGPTETTICLLGRSIFSVNKLAAFVLALLASAVHRLVDMLTHLVLAVLEVSKE